MPERRSNMGSSGIRKQVARTVQAPRSPGTPTRTRFRARETCQRPGPLQSPTEPAASASARTGGTCPSQAKWKGETASRAAPGVRAPRGTGPTPTRRSTSAMTPSWASVPGFTVSATSSYGDLSLMRGARRGPGTGWACRRQRWSPRGSRPSVPRTDPSLPASARRPPRQTAAARSGGCPWGPPRHS